MANTECSCSRPLFTVQCKDCDCIQKSLQQLIILIVVRRLIGLKKIGTIRNWMMSNIRQTITDKWLLQIYNSNTTNDVSQTIKINALIKVIICGISKAILDIWLLTTHTSWCTIILHHELRMLIIFFVFRYLSFLSMEISRRIKYRIHWLYPDCDREVFWWIHPLFALIPVKLLFVHFGQNQNPAYIDFSFLLL